MQATTLRAARAANTTVVSPVVGLSVGAVVVVLPAVVVLSDSDFTYSTLPSKLLRRGSTSALRASSITRVPLP